MTNFNDLCTAFGQALDKYDQYLTDCELLASDIWKEIQEFHQIPTSQLELYTFSELGDSEKVNGPMRVAMKLMEDSFFEFGLGITVYTSVDLLPYETLVIPICVSKGDDGVYKAKLGQEGVNYTIDRSVKADIQAFTESVLKSVMDQYKNGLSKMINQNTVRRVGFKLPS